MADTYRLRATGNTSSLSVWYNITLGANAVTLPGVGSICYANGFNGTFDYDIDIGFAYFSTEANAGLGVSAGGSWINSGATRNITGDFKSGTTACFVQSVNGSTVNHIGNCTGGTGTNCYGFNINATGCIATQTGNCIGGSGTTSVGLVVGIAGASVIVTGDSQGGSTTNAAGISLSSVSTISHAGNTTGGSNASAYGVSISTNANSSYTCTGQARSGAAAHGINITVAGTFRIHSVYNNVSLSIFAVNNTGGSTIIIDEKDDTGEYPTVSSKRRYSNTSQTLKGLKENGSTFTITSAGADYPPVDKVELNYVYANGTYTGTKNYNIDIAALTQAITDIQTANYDLQTVKTDLENVSGDLQTTSTNLTNQVDVIADQVTDKINPPEVNVILG